MSTYPLPSADTLAEEARRLFQLNNYDLEGPLTLNNQHIDFCATPRLAPSLAAATYVVVRPRGIDVSQYQIDAAVFAAIRHKNRRASIIYLAQAEPDPQVLKLAESSDIDVVSITALRKRFAQFEPYVNYVLKKGDIASKLAEMDRIYEESSFNDPHGQVSATKFLTDWLRGNSNAPPWIVVTGDYGTGKTALTQVLLRRWMQLYEQGESVPLPIRIELRTFGKVFDARGLLYYFLDEQKLGHLSVDFILFLVERGDIVFLLDGYDEMAQFMTLAERRACLSALAELSRAGARGLMTSRTNYFTETEEYDLFETFYREFEELANDGGPSWVLGRDARELRERERKVDWLLRTQLVDPYKRALQDLDEKQTQRLVRKRLSHDPYGQEVVLGILKRLYTDTDAGAKRSLSGKPVIVTYLIEVTENLKEPDHQVRADQLTEWQVYDIIILNLMLRDRANLRALGNDRRRSILRRLAVKLSTTREGAIQEKTFRAFVRTEFQNDMRNLQEEEKDIRIEEIFSDIRRSSTLTSEQGPAGIVWRFSHNSVREFLVAEQLIIQLRQGDFKTSLPNVTDAMQRFVRSIGENELLTLLGHLGNAVHARHDKAGLYLALFWEAGARLFRQQSDPIGAFLKRVCGDPPSLSELPLSRLRFSPAHLPNSNFSQTFLAEMIFSDCNLQGSSFAGAGLTYVFFRNTNLRDADFSGAELEDVDFSGAHLHNANFQGVARFTRLWVRGRDMYQPQLEDQAPEPGDEQDDDYDDERLDAPYFSDELARGYLAHAGARTDPVAAIHYCRHHRRYPIARKIARKLIEQPLRSITGLTGRGAARRDPVAAREFVELLVNSGLANEYPIRDQVEITTDGRTVLTAFVRGERLSQELYDFFRPLPSQVM